MLTVFCVRRAGEPGPRDLTLPECGEVRLIEEGSLGVWFCDTRLATGIDSIRAHDAVVRAALRTATPLPARFGTTFRTEEELRESLREREAELSAALERVAGRVEMGLRVGWVEPAPAGVAQEDVRSGRDYLEARRRDLAAHEDLRRRAEARLDEVERKVLEEGVPRVRSVLPEPGVAGVVAHLVRRHEVGAYRTRVAEARSTLPELDLRLSGPWAPYSFA